MSALHVADIRRNTSRLRTSIPEFVVDAMARLAREHDAIDLALGAPDYPPPLVLVEVATAALQGNSFYYPNPWGVPALRTAISTSVDKYLGISVDPNTEVTVACGATEGIFLSLSSILDPGDEVICFAPGYEGYEPAIRASGGVPRHVRLQRPAAGDGNWQFDPGELVRACGRRTRAILLNTPHNPTGKVFSIPELQLLADLCVERDLVCISDEIYSHMVGVGLRHVSIMQMEGMRDRTFLVNSFSKTFGIPGWRLGYVVAAPPLSASIRAVHDVVAAGVAAPLQEAAVAALQLPDSYFAGLAGANQARLQQFQHVLEGVGMICHPPQGAWYLLANFTPLGFSGNDDDFARFLITQVGVAAVPGSAFFGETPAAGSDLIRFSFGKSKALLDAAMERLGCLAFNPLRTGLFARGAM